MIEQERVVVDRERAPEQPGAVGFAPRLAEPERAVGASAGERGRGRLQRRAAVRRDSQRSRTVAIQKRPQRPLLRQKELLHRA